MCTINRLMLMLDMALEPFQKYIQREMVLAVSWSKYRSTYLEFVACSLKNLPMSDSIFLNQIHTIISNPWFFFSNLQPEKFFFSCEDLRKFSFQEFKFRFYDFNESSQFDSYTELCEIRFRWYFSAWYYILSTYCLTTNGFWKFISN